MSSFDIDQESVSIPVSRYKLGGLIMYALAFLVLGIVIIVYAQEISLTSYRYHPPKVYVILMGAFSAAFGGVASLLFIYRFFLSSKPGLIVDLEGIHDNSTLMGIGLIRWDEIIDIKEADQAGYINIIVKDPEKLVDRVRNPLIKRAIKADFNKHGTPVSIAETTLRCGYNELWSLLTTRFYEYQRAIENTHTSI